MIAKWLLNSRRHISIEERRRKGLLLSGHICQSHWPHLSNILAAKETNYDSHLELDILALQLNKVLFKQQQDGDNWEDKGHLPQYCRPQLSLCESCLLN